GADTALEAVNPGGTVLVFADAGPIPAAAVYRRELTVVGSRSATPVGMEQAARLLPSLDVPEPTVMPLERIEEALRLYRAGAVLRVVLVAWSVEPRGGAGASPPTHGA